MLTLLQNQALTITQWNAYCNLGCGEKVNTSAANLFDTCTTEQDTLKNAYYVCKPEGTIPTTATPSGVATTNTPPATTSAPAEDSSATGGIEFTGPISTAFIVGIFVIVCMSGSAIWYCYVRKTSEEKRLEQELRNFNLLDNPRTQTKRNTSLYDAGGLNRGDSRGIRRSNIAHGSQYNAFNLQTNDKQPLAAPSAHDTASNGHNPEGDLFIP